MKISQNSSFSCIYTDYTIQKFINRLLYLQTIRKKPEVFRSRRLNINNQSPHKAMRILFCCLIILIASAREYPLFNQCDTKWANQRLGTSSNTICQAGDLISSVAMAMAGLGQNQNPSTLNAWLKANKGYSTKNEFVWASVKPFGLNFEGQVPNSLLKINLDVGYVVIINVSKGAHWVLAIGYKDNTIYVKDSKNLKVVSYDISQVVNGHSAIYKVPPEFSPQFLQKIDQLQRIGNRNHLSSLLQE